MGLWVHEYVREDVEAKEFNNRDEGPKEGFIKSRTYYRMTVFE